MGQMVLVSVRTVAIVAAACVVFAACATDEVSGPATAALTLPPPSSAPTTPAPTTTTTTTTTPPTTTTTTIATTTTAVPAPKEPTGATAAVFAGMPSGPWVPLGGWNSSRFVGPGGSGAPQWVQGAEIRVSTLGAKIIGSEIGADDESCSGARGPAIAVPVEAPTPPGSGFGAIAAEGSWPLRPRPVVSVQSPIASYAALARELLGNRVPESTAGRLEQIVLADLDGDAVETSLVVYESTDAPAADGSGFSILFAVDTSTNDVTEIAASVVGPPPVPEEPAEDSPDASTTTLPPRPALERFRILDVADLNADRVMEVLVHAWTPARFDVDVHEVVDGEFSQVVGSRCSR